MNRYPSDPGPLVPGKTERFDWIPDNDSDLVRLRADLVEGGKGIWMFGMPGTDTRVVAEAHYPEDIRDRYYETSLEPRRRHDVNMGRLVCVGVLFIMPFSLDSCVYMTPPDSYGNVKWRRGWMADEINRNNRNARRDLRRTLDATSHRLAMDDMHQQEEDAVFATYDEGVEDAVKQTLDLGKPKNTPKGRF